MDEARRLLIEEQNAAIIATPCLVRLKEGDSSDVYNPPEEAKQPDA